MKKLHLICNAHIDPAWQWDYDEGITTALATFYSAIELAKEFDYIFCHNEVILYEYIEKYAPYLFGKIQELVKQGRWNIMGGWYDQPDCNVPTGESLIRQITLGREYFHEKFGVEPTTALNFDTFGHSRGLVQILKKCGYDSYIFCRPLAWMMEFTNAPFIWEGYDGSQIKGLRYHDETTYCSNLGAAKQDIIRKAEVFKDQEVGIALWGVGNHGGGPSRRDLADIETLIAEKKGECEIIHSTLENYFREVNPTDVYQKPFALFVKTYSSSSRIKVGHAELENKVFNYEKACSLAALNGEYIFDKHAFKEAERMLCQIQFHDVLSGTSVQEVERSSLRKLAYGEELVITEFLKAFHALAKHYPKIGDEFDPLILFNFLPYQYSPLVETEILKIPPLEKGMYQPTVYQDGKIIPSQVIKQKGNINFDQRKRLIYRPLLNPLGTTKIDVKFDVVPEVSRKAIPLTEDFVLTDAVKTIRINAKTGLLESLVMNGIEYLSGPAFAPIMFDDNEDPWGWRMDELGSNYQKFKLAKPSVFDEPELTSVHITESGDVVTEVETLLAHRHSLIRLTYKIYKDVPYLDVETYILWDERKKGLKLKISSTNSRGKYYGQVIFGTEAYLKDGRENPAQKFITVGKAPYNLTVFTHGVYGNSMKGKDLYLTVLNGSAYCAHPITFDDVTRPLVEASRYIEGVEQGRHEFRFRLGVNKFADCERLANEFAHPPYSVNMYPHGDGKVAQNQVVLGHPHITLTAFKPLNNGDYLLRLFNNSPQPISTKVMLFGATFTVKLGKYAFETYVYNQKTLKKSNRADLY